MEEHVAEKLRVIADTYRHWVDMVDESDYPGFDDCPLCRYSQRERRRRIHAEPSVPMRDMCIVCPIVLYTGSECYDDEDYAAYTAGVGSAFVDQDQVRRHGLQVQDKILSLWLAVMYDRTVEDWKEVS